MYHTQPISDMKDMSYLPDYLPSAPCESQRIRSIAERKFAEITANPVTGTQKGNFMASMRNLTNEMIGIQPKPQIKDSAPNPPSTNTMYEHYPSKATSSKELQHPSSDALNKLRQMRMNFCQTASKPTPLAAIASPEENTRRNPTDSVTKNMTSERFHNASLQQPPTSRSTAPPLPSSVELASESREPPRAQKDHRSSRREMRESSSSRSAPILTAMPQTYSYAPPPEQHQVRFQQKAPQPTKPPAPRQPVSMTAHLQAVLAEEESATSDGDDAGVCQSGSDTESEADDEASSSDDLGDFSLDIKAINGRLNQKQTREGHFTDRRRPPVPQAARPLRAGAAPRSAPTVSSSNSSSRFTVVVQDGGGGEGGKLATYNAEGIVGAASIVANPSSVVERAPAPRTKITAEKNPAPVIEVPVVEGFVKSNLKPSTSPIAVRSAQKDVPTETEHSPRNTDADDSTSATTFSSPKMEASSHPRGQGDVPPDVREVRTSPVVLPAAQTAPTADDEGRRSARHPQEEDVSRTYVYGSGLDESWRRERWLRPYVHGLPEGGVKSTGSPSRSIYQSGLHTGGRYSETNEPEEVHGYGRRVSVQPVENRYHRSLNTPHERGRPPVSFTERRRGGGRGEEGVSVDLSGLTFENIQDLTAP